MAWIKTTAPDEATGVLKDSYDVAIRRAGKVFNIIRIHSPRPGALEAVMRMYSEVMQSRQSGLSRAQREMIATAVSSVNRCHY